MLPATSTVLPAPRRATRRDDAGERGQIIVVFAFALVVLCGAIGLVIDGGSAFAQRRQEQNVADLAALGAATAYLNTTGDTGTRLVAATAAARTIASANGYTDGVGDTTVQVDVIPTAFASNVRVALARPHQNAFAGLLGMPTWGIGVASVAVSSSRPNGANGAMPLLFNEAAFPNAVCDETRASCPAEVYQEPGTGNEDVPQDATQFNWTIFCTANGNPCNANSAGVADIIASQGAVGTVDLGMLIGPLNAGAHTTLFAAMQAYIGRTMPVPIVNDAGNMVGWANFKLLAVEGTSQKVLRGYFVSPINTEALTVVPDVSDAQLDTGSFVIKIID